MDPKILDSKSRGLPMVVREKDVGKSEGFSVIEKVLVLRLSGTKASRRPTGLRLQESLENQPYEETQMTVMGKTKTGASSAQVS